MRLGVVDIGSNTVHLLVVDAHRGAQPLPASSHKVELRLSEGMLADGSIGEDAVRRLVAFVRECLTLAEDQGVEDLVAFATSAIREAPNGEAVLDRVRAETGVALDVLSGRDEARLTFLAVRRWYGWSSGRLLVVDIGGGSLELATGIDEEPDAAVSVPLGAGRVTRDHLPGDPPSPEAVAAARRHVRTVLARELRPLLVGGGPDRVVGTSKTLRSLARIAGAAPRDDGPYVPRHLTAADVAAMVPRLASATAAERALLPGVSPSRAHQLLGGALVADAALDLLRVEALEVCPWALREGIILRRLDHLEV
ncbi:Ppx/GppA phosphatase family protein [Lapillicoccus jejuensis]|uniref:Exopolyphosphatase/guanosine-5'-triphosphate, 3'-diphosphate pyrophosphatase n=1 Tax=Lapillicoccus jejuensis TaxID=402171 RepID=A0A542DXC4_9MICO|nr:Ppx/GppA phosphatase family protein [Lapillicoccus jejuensis]TQJ07727.1 exopolyphosphatase/guanosine-5'-triphosphate,3'-diphosphate pyrophosphatase [Lapillicoccus jejuensis]